VVFEGTDLECFEISITNWPYLGSLSDEQKKTKEEYLAKYTDKYQAIKHSTELPEDLSLWISVRFYDDGTGKLIPYPAGEGRALSDQALSKDQYRLLCYVKNDYIFEWHVEHKEAYLTDEEYELYEKWVQPGFKATNEEKQKY